MMQSLKVLGAGVLVYVVMAACSSDGGNKQAQGVGGTAGQSAGGAAGSAPDSGLDAFADALGDALTDPIPDAMADGATSGSRLRANVFSGADGSKQFIGWHDSTLNLDCEFQPTSEGVRCLPVRADVGGAGIFSFTNYYADDACTVPVYRASTSCAGDLYLITGSGNATCGTGYGNGKGTIATVAHAVEVTTPYQPTSNGCEATTNTGGGTLFTRGNEVPLTDFAAATIETE